MPIKIDRTTNPDTGKPVLKIEIDNGDLGGFDHAMSQWTFKNEESMLKFTIAVLISAHTKKLYVDDGNGKKTVLEPIDDLLAHPAGNSENDDTTKAN